VIDDALFKMAIKYPTRKRIGLQPTDSLAEAGCKVLSFHFARMIKYEAGVRQGEDIEVLHNMRVAVRRMRAAFRVLRKSYSKKAARPLVQGLKETGRALGPVRDLDVFMEKLQNYQASLPAQDEAGSLQTMLDLWQSKLEPARQNMLAYLDSKEYLKFKRAFLKFIKKEGRQFYTLPANLPPTPYQLRHIAPTLIYATYAEIRAYEPLLDNAPIETLHQMRLSVKKLRYTVEFFEEILGDGKQEVIADIKATQDHLGDLNDADVAGKILQNFLAEWEQHQLHLPLTERKSPAHLMAYLNLQLNERHRLMTTFPTAWANFNRPQFRENLAKAVAVL
jgi:CHAD domain-containing protein